MNQMKIVLSAAAFCLGMMGAQAQDNIKAAPASATPVKSAHNCLASTTENDWKNLGLTADQSAKVKEIQGDWRKSEGAQAKATAGSAETSPMMDSYEQKLKNVLSSEQYDKWVKWCAGKTGQADTKHLSK
jgi:Spy/CpxP family protein refolding chaperone